jgi:outer membrane immunogenic protein
MKKFIMIMSLISIGITNTFAQTQKKDSGFYAELGYMQASYSESVASFNNGMAALKAGYNIDKNFAIEGLIAGNTGSASFNIGTTAVTAQVQSAYGLYGKGTVELNETVGLYAKAGFTNGTVSASSRFGSGYSSGTSASYGAGIQANLTKDVYANLDYMSYYNKDGISITGPSISFGYKF